MLLYYQLYSIMFQKWEYKFITYSINHVPLPHSGSYSSSFSQIMVLELRNQIQNVKC